jgi:hypothetical protein
MTYLNVLSMYFSGDTNDNCVRNKSYFVSTLVTLALL